MIIFSLSLILITTARAGLQQELAGSLLWALSYSVSFLALYYVIKLYIILLFTDKRLLCVTFKSIFIIKNIKKLDFKALPGVTQ